MKDYKNSLHVSRRHFLTGSALSLASVLIAKWSPSMPFAASSTHSMDKTARRLNAAVAADAKRIYLAPDDHTDFIWKADEDTYRQSFLEMLDYYLDLADATEGNIPEHQSRWNCDGSFWMWTYERNRSAADFQRLIERIRDGHISVPLNALCVCLGGAPAEAVLRGMYYPGQIERRHDVRFPLAYMIENQTQPYGLVSLWAGAGAKYSWKGICWCDTRIPDAWDREHDIYWWEGPDGSRMLMKWNSMLENHTSMGGYAEARSPAHIVDYVDTDAAFIARYPYNVIGAFGKGWDDLKTLTDEFVTAAQQKTNGNRTVIVSNEQDFFEDFDSTYGSQIPSQSSSFGNEWDLYCAGLAEVSARVKRSIEKLRAAEAMATLTNLKNPLFMNGRQQARDLAWMNYGLFWEHNFGMVGPPSQLIDGRIAWQKRLASEIESYVDTLHTDAIGGLGDLIQSSGSHLRVFAFNPLGWQRTDMAEIPYSDTDPFHVVDLINGQEVPSQIVMIEGQRRLQILASDVPAIGYKVFEVRPGQGQVFSDAATIIGSSIENQYYKITVADRGAITSLIDKSRGNREFVRTINGRTINDLGPSSGTLQVEHVGPVSVTLLATASSPLAHTSRITLIRDVSRINIRNDINENFADTHTWGFSFDLDDPDIWHEEVGAVMRARLLTDGGHYSPRNARYDWLTLNHFADISNGTTGVTLSNADCYFMRVGNSTSTGERPDIVNWLDTGTPQISALVGGLVANEGNGLPRQGGDTHFMQRFALQTHDAFEASSAMRVAMEHQNPLVMGAVTGGSDYPETSFSLLHIDQPDILMWAVKPADDGIDHGVVARMWNLASAPANFTINAALAITEAQCSTHIETPIEPLSVGNGSLTDSIAAQQLKTYIMKFSGTPPPPVTVCPPTATTAIGTAAPTYTATSTLTPGATSTHSVESTPTSAATSTPDSTSEQQNGGCLFLPFVVRK